MKLFKMITLVTLTFVAAGPSAFAVGRLTKVEDFSSDSFLCEKQQAELAKRQVASKEVRGTDREVVNEQTGTVKSSM